MMAVPIARTRGARSRRMVAGGQLADERAGRHALGQSLRVLATAADEPAAQVTPEIVWLPHRPSMPTPGGREADALTFDHEHVPTELLEKLVAEGVNVAPPPHALVHAQDKLVMRRRLEALGAPVPHTRPIKVSKTLTSWMLSPRG